MAETYYDRLGVPEDATTAEIKRAYREQLKQTHPDVSDDEDASDQTKQLIEAKEVLTDDEERARYDSLGHSQYVSVADVSSQSGPTETSTTQQGSHETTAPETDSTTESSRARTGTAGTRGAGWSTASQEAWSGESSATTGARSQTSNDQRAPRDSWRDTERQKQQRRAEATDGDNRNTAWRTWNTDGAYSVGSDSGYTGPSLAGGQSLILICATFLCYPLMLGAALYPPFPLPVNGILALCVLLVVAYLQSIPTVGVLVFGTWSVLVPVMFVSIGADLFSPLGVAAVAGTVLPLGLSVLTRTVIRP